MKEFATRWIIGFCLVLIFITSCGYAEVIPRQKLLMDIRQLSDILESSHPDPYIRGGGKIAFHKKLHELMISVPEQGMTVKDFQKIILPFVAAVGDGHTRLHVNYERNNEWPGGIPLIFSIIEESLYVSGVFYANHRELLGSLLVYVNDIPFSGLCKRIEQIRGVDNKFGSLVLLSAEKYLYYKSQLQLLIPEWDGGPVLVSLKLPSGEIKRVTFDPETRIDRPLITVPSKVRVPSTKNCEFSYNFMDNSGNTALLKVNGMYGFRENFELVGLENEYALSGAREVYRDFHQKEPPEDKAKLLKGIPSATETFKSLVKDMKKHGTETLIIDLRHNGGGNSTLSNILLYFLFGKEHLIDLFTRKTGYEIIKYSTLYFDQVKNGRKGTGNSGIELNENDYWFEEFYEIGRFDRSKVRAVYQNFYPRIPTFFKEYRSGKYAGYYCPKNVMVLCSPLTYSSGYTMMRMLNESGFPLIGTPSSQSGNAPGWILNFKLQNSGLNGWVACKFYVSFSDKIKNGVYQIDSQVTYDVLKKYNFDPNSEILFALDLKNKM